MEKSWGEKLSTVDLSYESLLPGWTLCDKLCGKKNVEKNDYAIKSVFHFCFLFILWKLCSGGIIGCGKCRKSI